MSVPPASHPGAASLQDKAATNAGLTGDKIAGFDLATVPLGADAEAGGAPADRGAPSGLADPAASAARDPDRANALAPRLPWLWLLLALAAAVLLGLGLFAALD